YALLRDFLRGALPRSRRNAFEFLLSSNAIALRKITPRSFSVFVSMIANVEPAQPFRLLKASAVFSLRRRWLREAAIFSRLIAKEREHACADRSPAGTTRRGGARGRVPALLRRLRGEGQGRARSLRAAVSLRSAGVPSSWSWGSAMKAKPLIEGA